MIFFFQNRESSLKSWNYTKKLEGAKIAVSSLLSLTLSRCQSYSPYLQTSQKFSNPKPVTPETTQLLLLPSANLMIKELSNTRNIACSENEKNLLTYSTNRKSKINPRNQFAKHCTGQFILLLDRRKWWRRFAYESCSSCLEMVIKNVVSTFSSQKGCFSNSGIFKYNVTLLPAADSWI